MELKPLNVKPTYDPTSLFIGELIASVGIMHAFHLNTRVWSRHKALDEYYKDMPELIDVLAEAYLSNSSNQIESHISEKFLFPEGLLTHLKESGLRIHPLLSPELTNPLEDVLTFISQIQYKLQFS